MNTFGHGPAESVSLVPHLIFCEKVRIIRRRRRGSLEMDDEEVDLVSDLSRQGLERHGASL